GTGEDVLFGTDCSECFRLHIPRTPRMAQHLDPTLGQMIKSKLWDANVEDVRETLRRQRWKRQSKRLAWRRDHPITMRIVHILWNDD
ncbi:MAG: hypothetical protein MUP76_08415, partial [Acidimicrobiia bacterium]|nr:hypothetical protein [Acidimicrobiia bacterium]